jgi:diguanylate cyclase (GGDEF)-like protein
LILKEKKNFILTAIFTLLGFGLFLLSFRLALISPQIFKIAFIFYLLAALLVDICSIFLSLGASIFYFTLLSLKYLEQGYSFFLFSWAVFFAFCFYFIFALFWWSNYQKKQKQVIELDNLEEKKTLLKEELKQNQLLTSSLEKKVEKIKMLNEVIYNFSSSLELDACLEVIMRTSQKIFGGDRCFLWRVDGRELTLKKSVGGERKEGGFFEKWVLEKKTPLIVSDPSRDFRFPLKKGENFSLISVPIVVNKEIFSLLRIDRDEKKAFTQEDLRTLVILGNLASLMIENILLYQQTQILAITDGLTGLYLYAYFFERLNYDLKRARENKTNLSLLMIEIDDFKKCNDTYGHLAGDRVLKELADIFRKNVRHVDLICRYGGDEFAVIMPETDKKGAEITGERIRSYIGRHPFIFENQKIKLTVSVGVSSYPEDASRSQELIDRADQAMYLAKSLGKNKVQLFTKEKEKWPLKKKL